MGSGERGEWTFIDVVSIISFIVALENLDMNITQDDMQRTTERLDKALREKVEEIHRHLSVQDEKLNIILKILKEGAKDGSKRDF